MIVTVARSYGSIGTDADDTVVSLSSPLVSIVNVRAATSAFSMRSEIVALWPARAQVRSGPSSRGSQHGGGISS
ncbi:hypothetical protein [Solirubrobacter soli]|uniref:hypothetical protein n=1 Tax=Solirubrobacter soli TaxID=363832 RepID=UPI000488FCD2|nr:hypothetical protein [Solirubrobacter soli]